MFRKILFFLALLFQWPSSGIATESVHYCSATLITIDNAEMNAKPGKDAVDIFGAVQNTIKLNLTDGSMEISGWDGKFSCVKHNLGLTCSKDHYTWVFDSQIRNFYEARGYPDRPNIRVGSCAKF